MDDEGADSAVPPPERTGASRPASWRVVADTFASVLLVIWAVLFVAFVAVVDLAVALNSLQLEVQIGGKAACVLITFALPGLCFALIGRRRWQYTTFAAPLVFLALAVVVPWSERKQFVADLCAVETGMTVAEVEAVMDGWGYGFGTAYSTRPADWPEGDECEHWTGKLSYRWTPGNTADWGSIRFERGRVVQVHWSPD